MATVFFIRHGESEANAGSRTLDPASASLTARGRRQAARACAAIDPAPSLIVASAYARARETASPAFARFPSAAFEEWPVHEFTYLAPAAYAGTTLAERRPLVEAYWKRADPHHIERGNGGDGGSERDRHRGGAGDSTRVALGAESFAQFAARVESALARLAALDGATVAVFTHKKFMSAVVWRLVNGPIKPSSKRMMKFRAFDKALSIPNGAMLRVDLRPSAASVGPIVTEHLVEAPA